MCRTRTTTTGRTSTPPPSSTTATRCRPSSTRSTATTTRQHHVGTPAILGMNFQAVSVAEKVDSPSTLAKNPDGTYTEGPTELHGGYVDPQCGIRYDHAGPLLASALDYVNAQLAAWSRRSTRMASRPPRRSSSPPSTASRRRIRCALKRIKDGPIITAINAAWAQTGDQNKPDRRRNRRRPVADLPVGQDAAGRRLRQELPVEPQRYGGALQQRRREPRHEPVQHSGLAQI